MFWTAIVVFTAGAIILFAGLFFVVLSAWARFVKGEREHGDFAFSMFFLLIAFVGALACGLAVDLGDLFR